MSLEFYKNDVASQIIITIKDNTGTSVNISSISTKTYKFIKPDTTTTAKTPDLYTDGTDGKLVYNTETGFLDAEGVWTVQAYIVLGSQELTSLPVNFIVREVQNWEIEMTELLRVMIDDLGTSPTYTNSRLRRVLVAAAHQIARELTFIQTFTVDISEQSISPDPSLTGGEDKDFINLVCAKAACIIESGETRDAIRKGVMARDGGIHPTVIDLRDKAKGYLAFAKQGGACARYEKMRNEYQVNASSDIGYSVSGPFRVNARTQAVGRDF